MDKIILIVCILVSIIQTALCQPNLAALLGLGGFGDISEPQTPGSGSCPYRAHADRRKFSQMVNNRLMTQECAPGTMFVLSKCSCDNIPTGSPAGGPMPGSNPRQESALRGSGNALLGSLLSQLQGGAFPSSPTRAPPPPVRNRSPMNTNQLNAMRQKITSGVRPDQNGRGNDAGKPQPGNAAGMQYNPDPSTGLTSVADPSVLADVLPREILKILGRSNNAQNPSRKSSQTGESKAPAREQRLPESVQRMLDRASKPPTARSNPSPPNSPSNNKADTAHQPGSLPPEVLKMLQQSIKPRTDTGRTGSSTKEAQEARKSPSGQTRTGRITNQSPSRSPSPTRKSSPSGNDPLANIMAELQRGQQKATQAKAPSSGPRKDPLAALLAGVGTSSRGATRSPSNRGITRGPSRVPTRAPPRAPTGGAGGPPGGDPLAALLGGIGGGSGASLPGGGSDPLAALMAGGGLGSSGAAGNSGLAALLGGTSGAAGSLENLRNTVSLSRNVDLTNFFNAQGLAGGTPSLASLNNINFARLQQLDTYGLIDVGDLTPAGLIAADAHFSG